MAADTSHWMPKSARRQNTENEHTDRQTHRTTTVTLDAHARGGLISSGMAALLDGGSALNAVGWLQNDRLSL